MKIGASTIIAGVLIFMLLSGGDLFGNKQVNTGVSGAAPQPPPPQPQSGGGDTFNQVMGLIAAGAIVAGKALDLASDRGGPK